jgi:hypothetical protein
MASGNAMASSTAKVHCKTKHTTGGQMTGGTMTGGTTH